MTNFTNFTNFKCTLCSTPCNTAGFFTCEGACSCPNHNRQAFKIEEDVETGEPRYLCAFCDEICFPDTGEFTCGPGCPLSNPWCTQCDELQTKPSRCDNLYHRIHSFCSLDPVFAAAILWTQNPEASAPEQNEVELFADFICVLKELGFLDFVGDYITLENKSGKSVSLLVTHNNMVVALKREHFAKQVHALLNTVLEPYL